MAIGGYDAIDRAARRLRDEPEPGWQAIEQRVIAAVRATPRGGWPLEVEDPQSGALGRCRVTDLVVSTRISRALAGDPDFVVTDIDVVFDHGLLQAVSVTFSGRYVSDLVVSTRRVHTAVDAVLDDAVGGAHSCDRVRRSPRRIATGIGVTARSGRLTRFAEHQGRPA